MSRSRGFTLIELVMVIVLLAIVATISVRFVTLSTQGAIDVSDRQKRALKAVVVAERLSRELRGAVPGSVRVDPAGDCVSFLPALDGGLYQPKPDGTGYEPVNSLPGLTPVIASPSGSITPVGDVLDSALTSPESRLYYVQVPVALFLSGNGLYRKPLSSLTESCAGNKNGGTLLAGNIASDEGRPFFTSDTPTIRSNSLVTFSFQVDPGSGEPLSFSQTLQVRNVP